MPGPVPDDLTVGDIVDIVKEALALSGCKDFEVLESADQDPGKMYLGFYTPVGLPISVAISYTE